MTVHCGDVVAEAMDADGGVRQGGLYNLVRQREQRSTQLSTERAVLLGKTDSLCSTDRAVSHSAPMLVGFGEVTAMIPSDKLVFHP